VTVTTGAFWWTIAFSEHLFLLLGIMLSTILTLNPLT